jgi:nucleoside transporter
MEKNTQLKLMVMMFLQFFVWGTWYATLGTYLGKIGFDGTDVGGIFSTINLGAIVAPLFVGIIADRFFQAQKILGILHLFGAIILYWLSCVTNPSSFYWILLLYSLCYMPTLAIANTVAFFQMSDPGKEFPSIRVLGTIGWIVAGLMIGNLALEDSHVQLQLGAAASVVLGIYAFFLPSTPPKAKGEPASIGKMLGLDALQLMKDRSFAVLIIGSLLVSIPLSFYYIWANPFFNEEGMVNAASKMTMGQGSEIVFMLLMPVFFARLGIKKMIMIGIFCWFARYILFAYGNNEDLVFMFYLGILIHGVCYDFFFVTGQIYVDSEAPEKVRSSAQGLITLVTYGVGMYIGAIIAGHVVESYQILGQDGAITGHDWVHIWWIPALLALVVLILFAIFFKEKTSIVARGESKAPETA